MAVTLTTSFACLLKAGKNVSPDMTSSSIVYSNVTSDADTVISEWINQFEGEVNDSTTFDWVTAYSSLGTIDKKLLDGAVSSLVANEMIKHDMSGYTSRGEAESLININLDTYKRQIRELKDVNTQEYMGAK